MKYHLAILASAATWFISGCAIVASVNDTETTFEEPALPISWLGKSLYDVESTGPLAFHDGRLILATGGGSPGISLVDTATDTIVGFLPLNASIYSMSHDSAGRFYLLQASSDPHMNSIGWLDMQSGDYHATGLQFPQSARFSVTMNKPFLVDPFNERKIYRALNLGPTLYLGPSIGFDVDFFPMGIAEANGSLFVSGGGRRLHVLDTSASSVEDSISLVPDSLSFLQVGNLNTSSLESWNGKVFVVANWVFHDSSFVAVIDAATRTLVKTIPLRYQGARSAGMRDGILYVIGLGKNNTPKAGGIEAIDMTQDLNAGVVVTEAMLGGNIQYFVSTGADVGYVSCSGLPEGHPPIRRISLPGLP